MNKNLYKIKFECYIFPKQPYFSLPEDLETQWEKKRTLVKQRHLFAKDKAEAERHLKRQWQHPISILSIEEEKVKERDFAR